MRQLLFAALVGLCALGDEAPAQMIRTADPMAGAKKWPGIEAGIARYRVYRAGMSPRIMREVVEKSPWYHFTDETFRETKEYMRSIERIEPILQADLDREAAAEAARGKAARAEAARREEADRIAREAAGAARNKAEDAQGAASGARTSARTTARDSAPTSYRSSAPERTSFSPSRSGGGSSMCGATTKKGGSCRRLVSGGGYCYQHR